MSHLVRGLAISAPDIQRCIPESRTYITNHGANDLGELGLSTCSREGGVRDLFANRVVSEFQQLNVPMIGIEALIALRVSLRCMGDDGDSFTFGLVFNAPSLFVSANAFSTAFWSSCSASPPFPFLSFRVGEESTAEVWIT